MKKHNRIWIMAALVGMLSLVWMACSGPVDLNNNNTNNTNTNTNENANSNANTDTGKPSRSADAEFVEKNTTVKYKGWIKVRGSDNDHYLMGTGVRFKIIVNVYAIGFYIDTSVAREMLKPWKGKTKEELEKDDSYFDLLLKGKFGKTLRLVMVRDVDKQTMSDAFKDSLKPRIEKLPQDKQAAANEALTKFTGFFTDDLKDKDEILMIWLADGTIHVEVNGKLNGSVESGDLGQALFDIYLGADPISADAKKDMVFGMGEMF